MKDTLFDFLPAQQQAGLKPLKSDDWKWKFSDYPQEKNGLKVFSCFACGGGSTMGYKLAGCQVLGCCEIDKQMNEIYKLNHHPKHNYLMDIRDFNKIPNELLPGELLDLDILDGSPPCTTFSMAGEREESWGKKKKFREGQKEQTLDDLSFVFIETVKKLQPKTVIMENVEGLLLGQAFKYVQKIYQCFDDAGYSVHHWLMKGQNMGIPQKRHRVFFVAIRKDMKINPSDLNMTFNYEKVLYGQYKSNGLEVNDGVMKQLLLNAKKTDTKLSDVSMRMRNKNSCFQNYILHDDDIMPTLRASGSCDYFRYEDKKRIDCMDVIHSQTFPQDYNFVINTIANINYICGMSVPPVMIKRIVIRLIEQGVFDYKVKDNESM